MVSMRFAAAALLGATLLAAAGGCTRTPADGGQDSARMADASAGADWQGYGRTFGEQHFSPLTEISDQTIDRLGLAWSLDLPPGNIASQPIAIDGIIYISTGLSVVRAIDGVSGKQLWEFDPRVGEVAGKKMRNAWGSRGLAFWGGKVFVGTLDGRLIAIDAKTGKQAWSAMTIDKGDENYITGAPRVFDGKVVIGFGGADVGFTRGYVTAYDAETGSKVWRWHTVPGDPAKGFENKAMEMAAKTWSGEWWKYGGGGTVWNAMSYDPETGTLFIGTGNGTPWNHKARSEGKGDNLFLASIVALDGKTGQYKWHYQVNPGETWDFTATMDMHLADLSIDGKPRKVLVTAPKNGFLYVIDRITGKLVSAEPFAKVNWATKIDLATGRPVETPEARFPGGSVSLIWPSDRGAHSWHPSAFSPKTGLVYIPVNEKAATWTDFKVAGEEWRKFMPIGTTQAASMLDLYPKVADPLDGTSRLVAWDVVRQKAAWSVPTPGPLTGGVMATGGNLVFNGQLDGSFNAYAADSGRRLWSFRANAQVLAPPITFTAKGRQYVTVLAGTGAGAVFLGKPMEPFVRDYRTMERRVLTFAIGGTAKLPVPSSSALEPADDPDFSPDAAAIQRGAMTFAVRCGICHGFGAVSSGFAPELRASAMILSSDAFSQVVRDGAFKARGMPQFGEFDQATMDDLRQYLRAGARDWKRTGNAR